MQCSGVVTKLVLILLYSTLNSFKLCTHQWMCSSSDTPVRFIPFVGVFVLNLRGCSGSTNYKVQRPRRNEGVRSTRVRRVLQLIPSQQLSRACLNLNSLKHACSGRQSLSLASVLLLPDRTRETFLLEFLSSRNRFPSTFLVTPKKDCFSKMPLSR